MRGKVTTVFATYGFIKGEDGVVRFFIPSSLDRSDPDNWGITWDDLEEKLKQDEMVWVEFDHQEAPKGPRAVNVRIVHGDKA